MLNRMIGTALLRAEAYEDVEHDRSATKQALLVVIIVAIATGVGGLLSGETDLVRGLAFGVVRGIVSWVVWALIALCVGARLLRTSTTHADWGQLARGTGFAQSPGVLNVLAFLAGGLGGLIVLVVFIWQWAAMVVAVRQTLDYQSTLRAFFVILISAIPVAIINGIVFTALGLWE